MRALVDRRALADSLRCVRRAGARSARFVARSASLALEAEGEDWRLVLRLPAHIEAEGETALDVETAAKACRGAGDVVSVCGDGVAAAERTDVPSWVVRPDVHDVDLPETGNEAFVAPADEWARAVGAVAPAAAGLRGTTLSGVLHDVRGSFVVVAASDGYRAHRRLARCARARWREPRAAYVAPLAAFAALVGKWATPRGSASSSAVVVEAAPHALVVRHAVGVLEAAYVDAFEGLEWGLRRWEAEASVEVRVDRRALVDVVRAASRARSERYEHVVLRFEGGRAAVSTQGGVAVATLEAEAPHSVTLRLDPRLLLDALAPIRSEVVSLRCAPRDGAPVVVAAGWYVCALAQCRP